jgi:uncharacterized spore protein YtfJ
MKGRAGKMSAEADVQALLDRFEEMRTEANASAALGKPTTTGECTVIPLAEVSYTFEAATGSDLAPGEDAARSSQATGQGRATVRPVAVVEVTPRTTRVRSVVDQERVTRCRLLAAGWVALWASAALVRILRPRR